jgi:hypothetical protein
MRLIAAVCIAASVAFAAAPNFSGTWKLNASKSDFGQFPAPSSMVQTINHDDPKLKVEVKQAGEMGEFSFAMNYTTDGKECKNPGFGGTETKSIVKWEGELLTIEMKGTMGDNSAFTMKDKWALSGEGKVLTIQRHFSSAMGEMDQKFTLEKQ